MQTSFESTKDGWAYLTVLMDFEITFQKKKNQ